MDDALREPTIQVGVSRTVVTTAMFIGTRNLASSTTRTGERSSIPGKRQVSCGLSDSTVPMPTKIASLCARIWNTRARAASPLIARRLAAGEAHFAVGGDRQLQEHMRAALRDARDVAGMNATRFLGAETDIDRDALGAQLLVALPLRPPDWDLPAPRPRARCRP